MVFGVLTLFDTVSDIFISFMCIDRFTGSGWEDAMPLSSGSKRLLGSRIDIE